MKKHIILCGRRQVGKTTMVNRLMRELSVPVYGYRTSTTVRDPDGTRHIYMYPAGKVNGYMSEENHVGDCNMKIRSVNRRVFEDLGVRLLKGAKPDGVIVMDEIGFMEIGADDFCGEILHALDGDIPVLAAVKDTEFGSEFLDKIRKHPNAGVYMLTEKNRDEVFAEVCPVVLGWNCIGHYPKQIDETDHIT
jgi:nucleoside-triphosphatase